MTESIPNPIIIAQILQAMPEVWAIYRFGSAGTPFERSDSDIDLAILTPERVDNLARWALAQDLAQRLRRDVIWWICSRLQRSCVIRCCTTVSGFTARTVLQPRSLQAGRCRIMCG